MTPKNFFIKCLKCGWYQLTTGLKADLNDLVEIKNTCSKCGKNRKFRCPKCNSIAKMFRKNETN